MLDNTIYYSNFSVLIYKNKTIIHYWKSLGLYNVPSRAKKRAISN
jgi:hypothetical protein